MKKILVRMRTWLATWALQLFARLSRFVQIGNPHGRAPALRERPSESECLGNFEGGKVYSFENAISTGDHGGLMISGRNEVFSNLSHYHRGVRFHPDLVRLKVPAPIKLKGTGAYLCTPFVDGNFYHWMIDLLPRLWLLEQAGFTARSFDHVFVNGTNLSWETDSLVACGFRKEQIRICSRLQRYQIERLIVPDLVINYEEFAVWKARFLRRLFHWKESPGTRRIFCGRKNTTWRRLTNEEALFARLQPLGFVNLDPSGMSLSEQARLFSEAAIVVAVHGATLTNCVYLPGNAFIIEIQNRAAPQTYYTSMYAAMKIKSWIVPAEPVHPVANAFDANRVDFVISPDQIEAIVARIEESSVR
jgi:capsular polysaccharide biosynthesis protein